VQKYLRLTGVVGREKILNFRAEFRLVSLEYNCRDYK
jgi:hypothetical protein